MVETYNEGKQGHTVRIGEDDARQDLLHVNSRAVSKQPYIIEIMNQREQARWRTGSLPARCRPCSSAASAHEAVWRARAGQATGRFWQQSATNQIIVHGRCPHKRSWKTTGGRHSLDFSQTSTACGQLPASGDATRAASNMNYILNRAGGLSPVATQATGGGGYPTRGTDIREGIRCFNHVDLFAATWAPTILLL